MIFLTMGINLYVNHCNCENKTRISFYDYHTCCEDIESNGAKLCCGGNCKLNLVVDERGMTEYNSCCNNSKNDDSSFTCCDNHHDYISVISPYFPSEKQKVELAFDFELLSYNFVRSELVLEEENKADLCRGSPPTILHSAKDFLISTHQLKIAAPHLG